MSSVIILGDPHIGKGVNLGRVGIGANLNSRIVDQIALLDWTLDQAIDLHSDHIIITGDVFEDPKPHPSLIALFISWLKKCNINNVKVHIIAGNHDILRNGYVYTSPLDIIQEIDHEGIYIYKDIDTIIIDHMAFTMIPFRDRKSFSVASASEALQMLRDSLVYELASIPSTYTKIIVGHLAIEGSIPIGDEIDDLTNELFCPINMFSGYDYVWMGHVHKPQVMNKSKPHVAHVGSMDISNFAETDHKKSIIVVNCDNNFWEYKYLPTRSLKKVTITVPKDIEDSTEYVLDELKKIETFDKSIVKIDIALASADLKPINKSNIEKYLTSQGVFNIAGISESKKISLIKKESNTTFDTKMDITSAIKTYASTYVDENIRSSFLETALEIYNHYKNENKE